MKVVKFGGSSLASAVQLKKAADIVKSDPLRRIVVVSAPGKRTSSDTKVTDLLIACGEEQLAGVDGSSIMEMVITRYEEIAGELQCKKELMDVIRKDFYQRLYADQTDPIRYLDALKAAGEDNHAKLAADFFTEHGCPARYVNPSEAGMLLTDEHGYTEVLAETYRNLYHLRGQEEVLVIPGFFGFNKAGEVVTFSRSGSDITGSIVANGIKADLYENFTDVDAVCSVNPGVVGRPKEIKELTYREMRELSYAGFSVFHDEALVPAFRAKIPVHIKNTNNPLAPGTRIVNERPLMNGPVVGIASGSGFSSIYLSKYLMNREIGFGRKLLQILEEQHISYEHIPSGIDDVTVILKSYQLDEEKEADIIRQLKDELKADVVKIEHDLSLIMIVGEGMRRSVGTASRASKALAETSVNIEMINQGSSEVSMMFGVKAKDELKAVRALYHEFFAEAAVH